MGSEAINGGSVAKIEDSEVKMGKDPDWAFEP